LNHDGVNWHGAHYPLKELKANKAQRRRQRRACVLGGGALFWRMSREDSKMTVDGRLPRPQFGLSTRASR
jgi:hypothetical protein